MLPLIALQHRFQDRRNGDLGGGSVDGCGAFTHEYYEDFTTSCVPVPATPYSEISFFGR